MNEPVAREGRRKTNEKEQLSRDDWLDAAASAIAEGGFDNLRVLLLAKKLGVTRGSFYWHFKDHQDLVVSFLQRWRERRLAELANLRPIGNDVEEETRRIMQLLLSGICGACASSWPCATWRGATSWLRKSWPRSTRRGWSATSSC